MSIVISNHFSVCPSVRCFVCPSICPSQLALRPFQLGPRLSQVGSASLQAVSQPLPAGSKLLPASSEALPAGFQPLPAGSNSLSGASELLQASLGVYFGYNTIQLFLKTISSFFLFHFMTHSLQKCPKYKM